MSNRSLARGSPHAMSFSAARHSESGVIIRHLLNNTKPQDLHAQLSKAVNGNVLLPEDLDIVLEALKNCGIATMPSQLAAHDDTVRHCVRCHKNYLERDNTLMACIIPHNAEPATKTENGTSVAVNYLRCCEQHVPLGFRPPPHCSDRHTTVQANVVYNGCNVVPCVPANCFPPGEQDQKQ